MWHFTEDRYIGQQNLIECPEPKSMIIDNWSLMRAVDYRKPAIQINKNEGSLFSHTFYKIHSKYIRDINIILESIILLAEKSEEKIYYLSLKDLIGHWRQAKIEGIDYIKV